MDGDACDLSMFPEFSTSFVHFVPLVVCHSLLLFYLLMPLFCGSCSIMGENSGNHNVSIMNVIKICNMLSYLFCLSRFVLCHSPVDWYCHHHLMFPPPLDVGHLLFPY